MGRLFHLKAELDDETFPNNFHGLLVDSSTFEAIWTGMRIEVIQSESYEAGLYR